MWESSVPVAFVFLCYMNDNVQPNNCCCLACCYANLSAHIDRVDIATTTTTTSYTGWIVHITGLFDHVYVGASLDHTVSNSHTDTPQTCYAIFDTVSVVVAAADTVGVWLPLFSIIEMCANNRDRDEFRPRRMCCVVVEFQHIQHVFFRPYYRRQSDDVCVCVCVYIFRVWRKCVRNERAIMKSPSTIQCT